MKKTALIFVTLLFLLNPLITSVGQDKPGRATVTFFVEEMNCVHCKSKVEKNISFEKGVTDLKCNLESKTVEITYKKDKTSPEKLVKGFEKIKMTAVPVDSVLVKKSNRVEQ